MNTGTTAAKEAGNIVDLDSNPTKLIEIVESAKQLLMTRGAFFGEARVNVLELNPALDRERPRSK